MPQKVDVKWAWVYNTHINLKRKLKMSLKLKALGQLVGLIIFAIAVSLSVDWVFANVSRETLVNATGAGFVGMMLYFAYEILLARLESKETLDKIEQSLKK